MKGRDDDIFSENRGKIIRVRQKTDALLATSLLKLEVEIYPATMSPLSRFLISCARATLDKVSSLRRGNPLKDNACK
jgi:hypothetical protein